MIKKRKKRVCILFKRIYLFFIIFNKRKINSFMSLGHGDQMSRKAVVVKAIEIRRGPHADDIDRVSLL